MSAINGDGYGSSHDWRGVTPQDNSKRTIYDCAACGSSFTHFYDETPDIFRAIERAGVVDVCPTGVGLQEATPIG